MEQINWKLVLLEEENALAFRPYIISSQMESLLEKGHYGIGILADEQAAGALVAVAGEDALHVTSLMVSQQVRGQGAGKQLMDAVKALARRIQKKSIHLEFPSSQLWMLEQFLRKQGFAAPVAGNRIFKIPIGSLKESMLYTIYEPVLKGKIMSMLELEGEMLLDYLVEVGRSIPDFVSVEAAGPNVIRDATLGYVEGGRVLAFVVCSRLADGALYLNSVYAAKGRSKALYPLLRAVFETMQTQYADAESLYVAAANEDGMAAFSHLVGDKWDLLDEQVMQEMTYTLERSENMEKEMYPAVDILVPKLLALQELLEERGMESDLIVSQGNVPTLHVSEDGKMGRPMALRYLPLDRDTLDRFVLHLMAQIPCAGGLLHARQSICDRFNLESFGPMACLDPMEPLIYLRTCLPEAEVPVMPEVFFMALDLFEDGCKKIQKALES